MKIDKKTIKSIAKMVGKTIVIFDLETTSASVATTETVQFGAIKITKDAEYSELDLLIKPEKPIEDGAFKVHGISNEMVKNCFSFKEVSKKINEFFKGAEVCCGFNAVKFDQPILTRQMQESGYKDFFKDRFVFDSYLVYCQQFRRKLADACKHYLDEEFKDGHDALRDVVITTRIMAKQMELEGKPIEEIKQTSERSALEKYIRFESGNAIINFGKHKDTPLEKMDANYLQWIYNGDFPNEFKIIIKPFVLKVKE